MISRKARNDLVDDYKRALSRINQTAHILEDTSIFVSAAGEDFTPRSARLIDQTNALYIEIHRMVEQLREVSPDD